MTCLSHMHGDSDQETLDQADCKPLSVQQSEKQREARGSHSTKKRMTADRSQMNLGYR